MKKFSLLYLIPLCMGVMTACSSDDSDDDDAPIDPPGLVVIGESAGFHVVELTNTSVVIGASVNDMARKYMAGLGHPNASLENMEEYGLNKSTLKSMMQQMFYVALSNSTSFAEGSYVTSHGDIVGDSIIYGFVGMTPSTTYYFRVYQPAITGDYVFNDATQFETKGISATVEELSFSKTKIVVDGEFSLFMKREDQSSFSSKGTFKNYVIINGLRPGTTYYYYVTINGAESSEQSFTTKELDLSGTTVESKKTQLYEGCKGTYKFTVTSDLAEKLPQSKLKFGAAPIESPYTSWELDVYSSSTKSPYVITLNWEVDDSGDYRDAQGLYDLIRSGEADDDDRELYEELLATALDNAEIIYFMPFVEIDGERIFIGNYKYKTYK